MSKKPMRKIEWMVYCLAVVALTLLIYLFLNRNETSVMVEEELAKTKDKVVAYNNTSKVDGNSSYNTKSDSSGEDLSSIFNSDSPDVTTASAPKEDVSGLNNQEQSNTQQQAVNTAQTQNGVEAKTVTPNASLGTAEQGTNSSKIPALAQNTVDSSSSDVAPQAVNPDEAQAMASTSSSETQKTTIKKSTTTTKTTTTKKSKSTRYGVNKSKTSTYSKSNGYASGSSRAYVSHTKKTYCDPKGFNWTVLNRYQGKPNPGLYKIGNYRVKAGDNMWRIAKKLHKREINLVAANPKLNDPDQLTAGQIIAVTNK